MGWSFVVMADVGPDYHSIMLHWINLPLTCNEYGTSPIDRLHNSFLGSELTKLRWKAPSSSDVIFARKANCSWEKAGQPGRPLNRGGVNMRHITKYTNDNCDLEGSSFLRFSASSPYGGLFVQSASFKASFWHWSTLASAVGCGQKHTRQKICLGSGIDSGVAFVLKPC